ncbi:hypothetical protein PVL29_012688 [Vitis rotundifolia]|uniref:Uncharacterized protein n=1 Tax=Vitis rotundifolia TaxID=103349 RepID=A0AA38ZKA4_VITRO|nr:hypothetical protein PVL29_012688 [Vitis rotundifolia]
MSTAHTWSVAEDHNLVSVPSKNDNHLYAQYSSLTVKFASPFSLYDEFYMEHAQKLEEVRSVLNEVGEGTFEVLLMIDIEAILQRQYRIVITTDDFSDNLYEVALRFRLLRQEGYYVTAGGRFLFLLIILIFLLMYMNEPTDVFNNFKDKEGKFEEKLGKDVRRLMGLYKASQLSVQGEDILEEARNFSNRHLNAWNTHNDQHQARIVRNTLGHSHHKSLARFMAKRFLNDFQGTDGWINSFRQLAKMDFNMYLYNKNHFYFRWWKDLGLAKELKFARNQPLKWHMWPLAVLPDPSLSEQRVKLTKPISLVHIIDDIFYVHGTLDELTLFTEAAVGQLPDYMKVCFNALNGITNEISSKVYKDYGWKPVDSLPKSWAILCNAFLTDDYSKNGIISSGVHVVLVHMFFLLGHGVTKRNVGIVDDFPGIISSAATILRLWDDLGSAKEHPGTPIKNAPCHVMHTMSETWKLLNQQCLVPNPFSTCFTKAYLNVARMVPLMYSYDDNQCLPSLEEHMKSLVEPSVSS